MKSRRLPKETSPDQIIADPRCRTGHRVRDGAEWFDDAADAAEESRDEAIEESAVAV